MFVIAGHVGVAVKITPPETGLLVLDTLQFVVIITMDPPFN